LNGWLLVPGLLKSDEQDQMKSEELIGGIKMNSSGKSIAKILGSIFSILMISSLITAGAVSCDTLTKSADDSATSCDSLADCDKECTSCDCESAADCEQINCDCELCDCNSIIDSEQDDSEEEDSKDHADCNKGNCDSCDCESVLECDQAKCDCESCDCESIIKCEEDDSEVIEEAPENCEDTKECEDIVETPANVCKKELLKSPVKLDDVKEAPVDCNEASKDVCKEAPVCEAPQKDVCEKTPVCEDNKKVEETPKDVCEEAPVCEDNEEVEEAPVECK